MTSQDTAKIASKEDFAAFLDQVIADHNKNGAKWENCDIPSFIEALQAWLRDSDGYYMNQKVDPESVKPWREIADAFVAARIYE